MTRGGRLQTNGRRISHLPMLSLYNAALTIAAPFVRGILAARARHRPLLQRFDPPIPSGLSKPVWIHACSVGEVNLAHQFIHALALHRPGLPLLLTVSTVSGRVRAEEALSGTIPITWFPFDQPNVVSRFFDGAQPRALLLIETELWPNVLKCAAERSIPVALINGRISDKHLNRYRRTHRLFQPLLQSLQLAAMQSDEYARRITDLGANPANTHVTGNLKFDTVLSSAPEGPGHLRQEMGIPPDAEVIVFGSTRPGDEAIARACWDALQPHFSKLVLIVAPRHLTRLEEALKPFAELPILRRSQLLAGTRSNGERIVVLDTLGELKNVYAIADVAVIGGSFSKDVQGHNPIEPAALGVPVVFGPFMRNFQEAAELLLNAGGATQASAEKMPVALKSLLSDPEQKTEMGRNAQHVVVAQSGATTRSLDLLNSILDRPLPRVD